MAHGRQRLRSKPPTTRWGKHRQRLRLYDPRAQRRIFDQDFPGRRSRWRRYAGAAAAAFAQDVYRNPARYMRGYRWARELYGDYKSATKKPTATKKKHHKKVYYEHREHTTGGGKKRRAKGGF